MTSRVEFSTTDYQMSHGRQPRGYGSWAFFFTRNAPVEEAFWVNGATYAEAKKAVRAEVARRFGADHEPGTVYVGT